MTQCSLTAKMKKAMHLQDVEVKNAAEWKVTAEVVGHFLPLRPLQSVAAISCQAPCRKGDRTGSMNLSLRISEFHILHPHLYFEVVPPFPPLFPKVGIGLGPWHCRK